MRNMKKMMLAALALIMVLGSMKAFAAGNMDYEMMEGKIKATEAASFEYQHMEGKIAASQINAIYALIAQMHGFYYEAIQRYEQDGIPRLGVISRLIAESELLRDEAELESSADKISESRAEITKMLKEACTVARTTGCN